MTRPRLSRAALAVLLVATLSITSCVRPPATLTPPAQAAFSAQQVVQRIGELQQTVIDLSDRGTIPVPIARAIVQQTTTTLKALAGPPQDWKTLARQFWAAARPQVASLPALAQWLSVLDALIGGL